VVPFVIPYFTGIASKEGYLLRGVELLLHNKNEEDSPMRTIIGLLALVVLTFLAQGAAYSDDLTPSQVVTNAMKGVYDQKLGAIRKTISSDDLDKVDDYSDFAWTMIERITRRFSKWEIKSENITEDSAVVELSLTKAKSADIVVKQVNLKKEESGWKIKLFFNFNSEKGKDVPECLFDYTDSAIPEK
jgi:hypothetical protein